MKVHELKKGHGHFQRKLRRGLYSRGKGDEICFIIYILNSHFLQLEGKTLRRNAAYFYSQYNNKIKVQSKIVVIFACLIYNRTLLATFRMGLCQKTIENEFRLSSLCI